MEGSSPSQSGASAPVVIQSSPSSQSESSDSSGSGSSPSSLSGSSDSDTVSGTKIPIVFSYSMPRAICLGCSKVAGPFRVDSLWECFHCERTLDLNSC